MRRIVSAVAMMAATGILTAGIPASAAQTADNPMVRMLGVPVSAADIASAVGDCVAKDGDVATLTGLGYVSQGDMGSHGQMVVYRRGASGPLLALTGGKAQLRCWILAIPSDDEATVVAAIGARLGVPNMGDTSTPGWRTGDHGLTFDWFDEPGKPRMIRTEVYKITQETK